MTGGSTIGIFLTRCIYLYDLMFVYYLWLFAEYNSNLKSGCCVHRLQCVSNNNNNHFMALCLGLVTTRYQKKDSPTHQPDHHPIQCFNNIGGYCQSGQGRYQLLNKRTIKSKYCHSCVFVCILTI